MKTYAYGFPKLGPNREFKILVEKFWKKDISEEDFSKGLDAIQNNIIDNYRKAGIDIFSETELSMYDHMLDTAIMLGLYDPKDYDEYFSLCRGENALEMTKWFNTNYHYLVTDFSVLKNKNFKPNVNHFSLRMQSGKYRNIIGPYTFLKLSKGIESKDFIKKLEEITEVYSEILKTDAYFVIDEPAFCMDMSEQEKRGCRNTYEKLKEYSHKITLMTYYESPDNLEDLLNYPVASVGLDFIRGESALDFVLKNNFPSDKSLIAGLVDGRNIWKIDIQRTLELVKKLENISSELIISNAAPLYHLPYSVETANIHDDILKERISFAVEKLNEIVMIADGSKIPVGYNSYKDRNYGQDHLVSERVSAIKPEDFIKKIGLSERRKIQDKLLNLPLFPTTTIGSYPQTTEVRKKRADFTKKKINKEEFNTFIKKEIDKLIQFQESIGLDVFVHGEFERTDMVEFFAQKLNGIATTDNGWILSYGTRTYRPPIIYGDVSRSAPMTIDEISYAQSRTKKFVKGMLTGAVTIIAWSFCREDIPVENIAMQISLSLRDEIKDYEKAGIKIVQVDEPAFKEKAPLKKSKWDDYFKWAVNSFNLATNTNPETQIHTHMCYSEFTDIMEYINKMDFDVISIEASRSGGDILAGFEQIDFQRQIGLGVWDVHSPAVPPIEKMEKIVERSLKLIPARNFWINPDCGLKTRGWEETEASLKNMVSTAINLRKRYEKVVK